MTQCNLFRIKCIDHVNTTSPSNSSKLLALHNCVNYGTKEYTTQLIGSSIDRSALRKKTNEPINRKRYQQHLMEMGQKRTTRGAKSYDIVNFQCEEFRPKYKKCPGKCVQICDLECSTFPLLVISVSIDDFLLVRTLFPFL